MSKWYEGKKLVLEAAQKMLEKGLVVGTSGNVSLRLPPEAGREILAITPTSRHYDLIGIDDIQIIDFEAEAVEGDLPPSVESMLHIGIYRARKNVNAVIHTHSVFASAISVTGHDIPVILEDQVIFIGGEVKVTRYAPSGSQEQVESIVAALGKTNAVLLANHGAVGVGRTILDALTVCELVEKTAKVYYLASSLGKVTPLPADAVERGKAFFTMLQSAD